LLSGSISIGAYRYRGPLTDLVSGYFVDATGAIHPGNTSPSKLLGTNSDANELIVSVDIDDFLTGVANETDITDNLDGTATIGIIDPLIVAKGGTGTASLTDGGILLGSGTDAITALAVATNGQIPIGDNDGDPVLATITGTASEVDITNGAGSITVGIVDPLIVGKGGTGAATFTDGGILLGSGTGAITALGVATNGQIPIGDGTTDPVLATLTGTANQVAVTNGSGSITLSTPQDIDTAADLQLNTVQLDSATWQIVGTLSIDDVNENTFLGTDVFANDYGKYNLGIGYQAGYYNDTTGGAPNGESNVYIGRYSGFGDVAGNTGYYNVGIGGNTLKSLTSGSGNVAIGLNAGDAITSASQNFALGYLALTNCTTSGFNVAVGGSTLENHVSGAGSNVAIGYYSCNSQQTSTNNLGIGSYALQNNTGIGYNSAIGTYSINAVTSGWGNTAIGYYSLGAANAGSTKNVAIGYNTGRGAAGARNYSTFVGAESGRNVTTASSCVFLGYQSGYRQTTNSNLLITDNQDRGSAANEAIGSLLYGTFSATVANQALTINGDTSIGNATTGQDLRVFGYGQFEGGAKLLNGLSSGYAEFYEGSGSGTDKVTVNAQAMAADWTMTLPIDGGTNTYFLQTNGAGSTSWVDGLLETELDTFAELQSQIADKTLVNEEDAITLDNPLTIACNSDTVGAQTPFLVLQDLDTDVVSSTPYIGWKDVNGNDLGRLWAGGSDNSGWHFRNSSNVDVVDIKTDGDLVFKGSTSGLCFGEIYAYEVADTITIAASGIANKVQITSFDSNGVSNNMTPNFDTDDITVTYAGMYMCNVSLTIETTGGGGAIKVGASVFTNNGATHKSNVHAGRYLAGGAADEGSMSLSGIIDLAASDTVEVWIWNDTNGDDIVVDDVTLSLTQIGGT